MTIAVCTHGSVGISIIRKLFELRLMPENILVITHGSDTIKNRPLVDFLNYFNIEWFDNKNDMETVAAILVNYNVNMLLSVSYKYVFREPVLSLPNLCMVNLHPGLFPDYKGCFSIPWAIINGETHVGYTYHLIDSGIDTGDVILTGSIPIQSTSTAFSLHFAVMSKAIDQLGDIILGNWIPKRQIGKGRYYKNVLPEEDPLWNERTKERFRRAMYFPPFNTEL